MDDVKDIANGGRPLKRPNRNKPLTAVTSDSLAAVLLAGETPHLPELIALAARHQPPQSFFDGEVERPW